MTSPYDCGAPIEGRVFSGPTKPDPAYAFDLWYDAPNDNWYMFDGVSNWVQVNVGGGGGPAMIQPTGPHQLIQSDIALQWQVSNVLDLGRY